MPARSWLVHGMNGLTCFGICRRTAEQTPTVAGRISLSQVWGYLQHAVVNFDALGVTQGTVINITLLISVFHQKLRLNKHHQIHDHMKTTMPLRIRISRFIEERYVHRAQPGFFPELALFGLIVVIAVWPMLSLPAAMVTLK